MLWKQYFISGIRWRCCLNQFVVLNVVVSEAAGLVSGLSSFTVRCQIPVFVPKSAGKNKSFLQIITDVCNCVACLVENVFVSAQLHQRELQQLY